MFSFHSHSGQFCKHAKGSLEDVILSAIERRFTTYGLSEHMPRYKPDQLYPEESHLTTQDLESTFDQYLLEARRLQEKYRQQICLLIGFETEYFGPESIQHVLNLRQPYRKIPANSHALAMEAAGVARREREDKISSDLDRNADGEEDAPVTPTTTPATTSTSASISTPATTSTTSASSTTATLVTLPQVQYIVGSIHHVRGIPIDFSEELYMKALQEVGEGSWETLFKVFFDEQFEMIKGLEPEVVGHLDLVRIFFASISGGVQEGQKQGQLTEELWELVKRNVDYVIGYGGLFELNSRAWKKGLRDAYPQRDILEYILSKGGRLTLSDDSHGPDDVGMFYDPRLMDYLQEMKVTQVFYLAPVGADLDDRYITYANAGTWSFQHVHIRSKSIAELRAEMIWPTNTES